MTAHRSVIIEKHQEPFPQVGAKKREHLLTLLLRTLVLTGSVLAVAGAVTLVIVGLARVLLSEAELLFVMDSLFFAILVWLVGPRQPRNPMLWTMAATSFFGGVFLASWASAAVMVDDPSMLTSVASVVSGDLPARAAWALVPAAPGWVGAVFPLVTFGLLLFPDGKLPSPRWRWAGVVTGAGLLLGAAGWAWGYRPGNPNPATNNIVAGVGMSLVTAAIAPSLAALVVRFRRSSGATRQQFKWVVWGMSVFIPALLVTFFLSGSRYEFASTVIVMVAGALLLISYGIAVARYRLYDIDVVLNKTLVFAGLAAFISLIYAVVVVWIGGLLGGSNLFLSLLATAIVAVAFEPARHTVQGWANRVVYGSRATPYEVLSEITGRLAATESEEGLLQRMASMLQAGTGAARAAVWLAEGSTFVAAATKPEGDDLPRSDVRTLPGRAELIEHDGEVLGALTVEKDRGDAVTATEQALVADLAGSAALVLRKVRLDAELDRKAKELQESRRRLVDAQDVERRRLERDLHDGAQQLVVALKVKLGLARQLAATEGAEKAAELIEQITADTQLAIDQIRSLARGIYPPLLQADGLPAAVPALATASTLDVRVSTNLKRRYPLHLEGAVYFCIAEALTNAAKHGRGPIRITLGDESGALTFEVADSGPGFDTDRADTGSGLRNMADRIGALDGELMITSAPGTVTVVRGSLPVPETRGAGR